MDTKSVSTACSQLHQDSDTSSTAPTTVTPTTVAPSTDAGIFSLDF